MYVHSILTNQLEVASEGSVSPPSHNPQLVLTELPSIPKIACNVLLKPGIEGEKSWVCSFVNPNLQSVRYHRRIAHGWVHDRSEVDGVQRLYQGKVEDVNYCSVEQYVFAHGENPPYGIVSGDDVTPSPCGFHKAIVDKSMAQIRRQYSDRDVGMPLDDLDGNGDNLASEGLGNPDDEGDGDSLASEDLMHTSYGDNSQPNPASQAPNAVSDAAPASSCVTLPEAAPPQQPLSVRSQASSLTSPKACLSNDKRSHRPQPGTSTSHVQQPPTSEILYDTPFTYPPIPSNWRTRFPGLFNENGDTSKS